MVFFICGACGNSFKRKQAELHTMRCANWAFSCLDCQKDFEGTSYVQHTQCISESEKYFGQHHVAKVGKDKNAAWMERLREYVSKQKMAPHISKFVSKILSYPSVPRKAPPFKNFLKTNMNVRDPKIADELWTLLSGANQITPAAPKTSNASDKENISKPSSEVNGTSQDSKKPTEEDNLKDKQIDETVTNGDTIEERPKKKKDKKRKSTDKEHVQSSLPVEQVAENEQVEVEKPKKKKKSNSSEESTKNVNGTDEHTEAEDHKKKNSSSDADITTEESNENVNSSDEHMEVEKSKKKKKKSRSLEMDINTEESTENEITQNNTADLMEVEKHCEREEKKPKKKTDKKQKKEKSNQVSEDGIWMENLKANLPKTQIKPFIDRHILRLAKYKSIPNSAKHFKVFMRQNFKVTSDKVLQELWEIVHAAGIKPAGAAADDKPKTDKKSEKRKKTDDNSDDEETVEEQIPKKISKKNKLYDDDEEKPVYKKVQTESKSARRKKRNIALSSTEEPDMFGGKITASTEQDFGDLESIGVESINSQKQFKWRRTLKELLKDGPDEGTKVKKLLNQIEQLHNHPVYGAAEPLPKETLEKILWKTLSNKPFSIKADKAKKGTFAAADDDDE